MGQPTAAPLRRLESSRPRLRLGSNIRPRGWGTEATGRCFVTDPGSGSKHDPRAGSPEQTQRPRLLGFAYHSGLKSVVGPAASARGQTTG